MRACRRYMAGPCHLVKGPSPRWPSRNHLSRRHDRDFPGPVTFPGAGREKRRRKPDFCNCQRRKRRRAGPAAMSHPHNGPGPAVPPVPGGHGTAPGGPAPGRTGPGVPLSIWPGLPAPRSGPYGPCAGPVTAAAAARVIGAFSRPGDLVAAPDGSAAVIEAAAAAGRPVLGLIPAPVRDGRAIAGLRARLDPAARPFARLRPGGPALLLAAGDPDAGRAALAIAGC